MREFSRVFGLFASIYGMAIMLIFMVVPVAARVTDRGHPVPAWLPIDSIVVILGIFLIFVAALIGSLHDNRVILTVATAIITVINLLTLPSVGLLLLPATAVLWLAVLFSFDDP